MSNLLNVDEYTSFTFSQKLLFVTHSCHVPVFNRCEKHCIWKAWRTIYPTTNKVGIKGVACSLDSSEKCIEDFDGNNNTGSFIKINLKTIDQELRDTDFKQFCMRMNLDFKTKEIEFIKTNWQTKKNILSYGKYKINKIWKKNTKWRFFLAFYHIATVQFA